MGGLSGASAGGSWVLLRKLRDVMAQDGQTQTRLDRIVTQIASTMVADVCSIYLRRADGTMELCATEGLSPSAVHRTRLRAGEGLVGLVAEGVEPVSLSDAPRHPRFAYRPETGEDPFQSFLGVPVLRGGRIVGVLVVQNRVGRVYDEDEVESLQTVATVLAEIVSEQDLSGALAGFEIKPTAPEVLRGRSFASGLIAGPALLHDPEVEATRYFADDPKAEEERLDAALGKLRAGLEALLGGEVQSLGSTPYEVLETFLLLSQDRGWERRLREGIHTGLTAEASVEQVRSEHRARLSQAKDGYLRDRLHDLEELDNRLLRHLSGEAGKRPEILAGSILVARDIGPAELLDYGRGKIAGVLLEEGSPASHVAIVARAMGLPLLGQLQGLLSRVEMGDHIIVNAKTGHAYLRPDPGLAVAFKAQLAAQTEERKRHAALKDTPPVTRDGQRVSMLLNAGLTFDLEHLDSTGSEGVGLYRTEFQFMVADTLPRLDAQVALYSEALALAKGRPVTFRTLDLGGDKVAPYMPKEREENPAMGWRAVRIGLDRPGLSRYQLRALVRASEGADLRVMFPLVSVVEEFRACKALLTKELEWARSRGRQGPRTVQTGVMIEAPSIAWSTADIAAEADFLSIGTNDLMQFFFAADRGSAKVADRYDILSVPALRLLRHIREAAGDTPVSVCGEHAGRPLEALALLALGYRRLSMPMGGVGLVKSMLLALNAGEAASFLDTLLHKSDTDVRSALHDWAVARQIPLQ